MPPQPLPACLVEVGRGEQKRAEKQNEQKKSINFTFPFSIGVKPCCEEKWCMSQCNLRVMRFQSASFQPPIKMLLRESSGLKRAKYRVKILLRSGLVRL